MAIAKVHRLTQRFRTFGAGKFAAGHEAAAGLGIDRAGDLAADGLNLLVAHGKVGNRNGREKLFGVRMSGIGKEFL